MPSRPAAGAAPRQNNAIEEPSTEESTEVETSSRATKPVSLKRRRPRIIVTSGVSTGSPALDSAVDYPVQLSKVQAPTLRDDTLARERLLDWLSVKVHSRVVLLTAEAGYGKTTLLADFSRRTRIRVLWYRLDGGDRDWFGFIAHLIAAVRVHQPTFGASTASLLRQASTSLPPIYTVLDSLLRELGSLPDEPTVVVFDDVHLVDDSPELRQVFRELLARGPERMSFVFASRREPPIRLARLRALGEVAELNTDDLRFDAGETERLFRETYEMPLEPAVLGELNRRTEGWAASLQLVRAAIHDRNPAEVRSFISSLSGAEGHLYEYLAEEVIGDLPEDLQQFLMRTSVLDVIDVVLSAAAAEVSELAARSLIEQAERFGLVSRRNSSAHGNRIHPLVRDFLRSRLLRSVGTNDVVNLHLRVAKAVSPRDWQVATRHLIEAGHHQEAADTIKNAMRSIFAAGTFAEAGSLAANLADARVDNVSDLLIKSRLAYRRADAGEALALAEAAWANDRESVGAQLSVMAAKTIAGDVAGALTVSRLLEESNTGIDAHLGRSLRATLESSLSGSIVDMVREVEALAEAIRGGDADHYRGICLLNLALARLAQGDFHRALDDATEAAALFAATSDELEFVSARLARAQALEFVGSMDAARAEIQEAIRTARPGQALEVAVEVGQIEGLVGETQFAWPVVDRVAADAIPGTDLGDQVLYARTLLRLRDGDVLGARRDIDQIEPSVPKATVAFEARRLLAVGLVATVEGNDGRAHIHSGTQLARVQGAHLWESFGRLLESVATGSANISAEVFQAALSRPVVLSMLAEALIPCLPSLDIAAKSAIVAEAEHRPWRWRSSTRRNLESPSNAIRQDAAALLARIGDATDVERLSRPASAKSDLRGLRLAQELSRRLAPTVLVEDLGRVRILIGDRVVDGAQMRRKVLALLCILLTRPRFSMTRDEVIDGLWPDVDPSAALNSLNQTVYFLRRVFEPSYREDLSPGYVGQDGETVWLDPELVDSRSRRCHGLIIAMPSQPSPEAAVDLAKEYDGRFALDFAYEEWAAAFRDGLHAAYLRVMEHAIRLDLDTGHWGRGTFLAERAADIDPDSEAIQVALIRLYRHSGAHAAAAERYGRYVHVLNDLGVEAPAFADI